MSKVTLAEIAAKCGLAKSTVSYCLRNDPNIPLVTRVKVQNEARAMGYEFDPALAALARYRWPDKARPANVTIGVIYYILKEKYVMDALESEASRLGYKVNYFNARDYRNGRHLNKVLRSRGIRGIVVISMPDSTILDIDYSNFSVMHLGPENEELHFHSVLPDFTKSIELATHKAVELGYRKIGYALMDFKAKGTNYPYRLQATYERAVIEERFPDQPPILVYDPETTTMYRCIRDWYNQYKPDLIICTMNHPFIYLRDAPSYDPTDAAIRIPEEVGVILTRNPGMHESMPSHIEIQPVDGQIIIHLLHQMLIRGEKGLPLYPTRILTPCKWVEGDTTRDLHSVSRDQSR